MADQYEVYVTRLMHALDQSWNGFRSGTKKIFIVLDGGDEVHIPCIMNEDVYGIFVMKK